MIKSVEMVMMKLENFRAENIFSEIFVKANNLFKKLGVEAV